MKVNREALIKKICGLIIEAIADAGPLGLPSGHLYAALMPLGCTLDQYNAFISGLKAAGQIQEDGMHVLHITGAETKDGLPTLADL
jgi:hypothetical protein